MYSKHAHIRCQQRGIPPMLVDLLLELGTSEKAPGGVRKFYFDKTSRRRLHAYAGALSHVFHEHLGIYAVVGEDNQVITVGHRTERIERN